MIICSKIVQHRLRVAGPVDRLPCLAVMSTELRWTNPNLYLLITPFSSLQIGRISMYGRGGHSWKVEVTPLLLKGLCELTLFTRLKGDVDVSLWETPVEPSSWSYAETWEVFSRQKYNIRRNKEGTWYDNPAFYTTMHDCNFSANRRPLPILKRDFPRLAFVEHRFKSMAFSACRMVLCAGRDSEMCLCSNSTLGSTRLQFAGESTTRSVTTLRLKGDSEAGVYAIDKPIKINIRT